MREKSGPRFVQYFNDVLEALRELGGSGRPSEIIDYITSHRHIDEIEQEVLSDGTLRYDKNIHWARFYLAKAGLIDGSKRGVWALTEAGMNSTLNHRQAMEIFTHVQDQVRQVSDETTARVEDVPADEPALPEESRHRAEVRQVLLQLPPAGFERLCQRILREAGFEKVTVTGQTGDGGIDGTGRLRLNTFVSFQVCFQCKRYTGSVGASTIRDFRGSIVGRADKGIILTTGTFTQDAKREAQRDGAMPIELVDGEQIIDMLEEFEIGFSKRMITVYDVDHAFFDEFR